MARTYPAEDFEEGIEITGSLIGEPPGKTFVLVHRRANTGSGNWWYAYDKSDPMRSLQFIWISESVMPNSQ